MDKCHKEIYFVWTNVTLEVGICHRNLPLKFGQHRVSNTEIFLLWTKVARTNVAWTNVMVVVGGCVNLILVFSLSLNSKTGFTDPSLAGGVSLQAMRECSLRQWAGII